MSDPDLVVIRTFPNHFDADVAKSALEAADIESLIRVDDVGGMYPGVLGKGGVELLVRAEDAERADEILDEDGGPPGT